MNCYVGEGGEYVGEKSHFGQIQLGHFQVCPSASRKLYIGSKCIYYSSGISVFLSWFAQVHQVHQAHHEEKSKSRVRNTNYHMTILLASAENDNNNIRTKGRECSR